MKELIPMKHNNNPSTSLKWMAVFAVLYLIISPVQAYDQPWNGNREDITNPAPPPPPPCPGGDCDCPGDNNTGSPVYIADGSLVWSTTDIQFPATSQIRLKRTYTSTDYRAGLFGRGWVTAQESNIARTYKAVTEGNADGSPKVATDFKSVPIWLASYGRRYTLEETATHCNPPGNLFFTFEKEANGQFKQVFENSQNYNVYSATGTLLESYSDREGSTIYYEYDSDNRLVKQLDSYGYALNFLYNDQGFVSEVVDHAQRSWVYSYDTYGRLTQVTNPDGNTQDYAYQLIDHIGYKQHLLTAVNDNTNDPVLSVTWANLRIKSTDQPVMRVTSYSESDGHIHDYSYSATTYNGSPAVSVIKKTRQVGNSTVIQQYTYVADASNYRIYSKVNNTDNLSVARAYSDRGKLLELKDERGNLTRYEYDTIGNRTKTTELADTADEKVTTYQYWNNTNRVQVKNEYGILETQYTYDSDLRVTSRTKTDLSTGEVRNWSYTYHSNSIDTMGNIVLGKLATIDGPKVGPKDLVSLTYNSLGLLSRIDYPLNQTVSFSYNEIGQRIREIDSNNVITAYAYNSNNRVISMTRLGREVTYEYNPKGLLTSLTDEMDRNTSVTYNSFNKPRTITLPSGDYIDFNYIYRSDATDVERSYYSVDGTLISRRINQFDSVTDLPKKNFLSSTDQTVSTQVYNSVDDLTQKTLNGVFDGEITTATYNYVYDNQGRLNQIIDPETGVLDFSYDNFNQITSIKDANGGVTSYDLTAFGDVLGSNNPDTGNTSYAYDQAGYLIKEINANHQQVDFSYDALSRIEYIEFTGSGMFVDFTWDEGTYGKGRITSVMEEESLFHYQYDDRGLVIQSDSQLSGVSFSTGYGYNDAGQLTKIQYPSGMQVVYEYDSAGRLSGIQRTLGGLTSELLGQVLWHGMEMSEFQLGNGQTINLSYDNSGRLISKKYGSAYNSFENVLDNQNNTIQQTRVSEGTQSIDSILYDKLGRITKDGFDGLSYGYDLVGNRITKSQSGGEDIVYNYEANTNRASQTGAQAIELDAAGNTISDGIRKFRYNAMNQLAQVDHLSSGMQGVYRYNYLGQRVRKQVTGVHNMDVRFVYGQVGELLGEYDSSGFPIREYIYNRNGGVPKIIAQIESDGSVHYIHTDHLGTPRLATDDSGTIVWRWESDAFGKTTADEDPDADGQITKINIRFSGQYFDVESELHYNFFRYYDPATGRYTASDPVGLSGGVNTFVYTLNNPLLFTDPFGLFCQFEPWGGSSKMYTGRERTEWGPVSSQTLILPCWTGTPGAPCVIWTTKYSQIGVIMRQYRIRTEGKFVCYLWDSCNEHYYRSSEIDSYRDSDLMWENSGQETSNTWYEDGQNSGTDWGPDELPNPYDDGPNVPPLVPIFIPTPAGPIPVPL